ncbi:IS110 family transposase [Kibdelosporangium aridum]|uniref:IS110 family transposase n=1 Tax=Kibdelosporangium aridum TaxID=2030 RepID=UPI0035EECC72
MGQGSGVSRGDRNRNARLARLRALVPSTNAIVGIDLADTKQMVVVTDHDSKVLARKTFRCRAWSLGTALDWAAQQAVAKGFTGVTVACEPTGHRWRVLGQLAADRGMPFVCVQPMVTSWSRRTEDLTFDKTDEKDAVLIARLTAQLRCYIPEPVDETWGRLRYLGARREQLVVERVSQVQQIRALLECVWPAALDTARQPFRSRTWITALSVICERDSGDLQQTRRRGLAHFEQAVRREITRRGGQKPSLRIVRHLFTALTDQTGVLAHRRGALERVQFLLRDWQHTEHQLADTEARMINILDELQLTELVTSITGLSAIGAAAILAETGDLTRFATARAVVKHAGLAPREKLSGTFTGRTKLTGQGRPSLRLAAWRAVWGAQRNNPVYAARYQHLTSLQDNKLTLPKPKPQSQRPSCATCTPSSPPASDGIPTSPPTEPEQPQQPPSPPNQGGRKQAVGASPTRH